MLKRGSTEELPFKKDGMGFARPGLQSSERGELKKTKGHGSSAAKHVHSHHLTSEVGGLRQPEPLAATWGVLVGFVLAGWVGWEFEVVLGVRDGFGRGGV